MTTPSENHLVRWIDIANGQAPLPSGRVNVHPPGASPMFRTLKSVELQNGFDSIRGRWLVVRWHPEQRNPSDGVDCGYSAIHEEFSRFQEFDLFHERAFNLSETEHPTS